MNTKKRLDASVSEIEQEAEEQTDERKLRSSFSFLPKLAATDAAVLFTLYKLFDEMIKKEDLKQDDAAKLKKLADELKQKSNDLEKGLFGVELQLSELIQVKAIAES